MLSVLAPFFPCFVGLVGQEPAVPDDSEQTADEAFSPEDVDAMFTWQTGEIELGGGLATIALPEEYRYLDPESTKVVLEEIWSNPPGPLTLGMIFPVDTPIIAEESWAVVITFEECGYVSDDDAHEIDYDELLADMQVESEDENEERAEAGFGSLAIMGWAVRPSYDAASHKLVWAKELQFSEAPERTLNYDVRILGRRGVLSMNAIAAMDQLETVEEGMTALLPAVAFGAGHRYEEFDSSVDQLAAYGLGGLIAGKLALKAGLFKGLIALLVASKKFVVIALVGVAAAVGKLLGRKRQAQAGGQAG